MSIDMRRIAILIGLITLLTGCGMNKEPNSKAQSYPPDGYLGMTSVNPNQPLNPTYHNYREDTRLMKAVLAQFPGIIDSRISPLHVEFHFPLLHSSDPVFDANRG